MNAVAQIERQILRILSGLETSDGAGVRLTRLIGGPQLPQLDPFLMLDHFRSEDPDDYIAGFPPHPHRGFETVTYLLAGEMAHKDNAGHHGILSAGGVQWMTAGRGIVHSEMPRQREGLLAGFQLWVNLPSTHKMSPPRYQEFEPEEVSVEQRENGIEIRVVAGETSLGTQGPVRELVTPVIFLDVTLPAGETLIEPISPGFQGFLYPVEGLIRVDGVQIQPLHLAVMGEGEYLEVKADEDSRFLLIAGSPLREPVARRGPFVMNNEAELKQAFQDYQEGRF
ncbi:MAG: pirin family protein [Candidatus Thiodiazotropha sp.]|jgi:quercetin 2,3-dioxygenase